VVSLIRNILVTLIPEWVVTLNRNQVVSFSEISMLMTKNKAIIEYRKKHCKAPPLADVGQRPKATAPRAL